MLTEKTEGFLLDAGPDSWVVSKPHATALARDARPRRIAHRDEGGEPPLLRRVGRHSAPGARGPRARRAHAPRVRWRRPACSRGAARRAWPSSPSCQPRRFHGDDDESIAEFATRRLGKEAAERLVAPLLGGISAGDASDISVRAAFPQLVAMERDYGSLVQGMRAARRAGQDRRSGRAAPSRLSREAPGSS